MDIDEIHHYDTYVPIISDLQVNRTWDQANDQSWMLTPLEANTMRFLKLVCEDVGVIAIPTPANKAVRLVRAAILAILHSMNYRPGTQRRLYAHPELVTLCTRTTALKHRASSITTTRSLLPCWYVQ